MCDGKCAKAPACGEPTSDLAALRGLSSHGGAGRFAVTDAVATLPVLQPGSYLLHLESGDPAVTVSVQTLAAGPMIAADTTGLVAGASTFPGGAVARLDVLDAAERVRVQLLPSGSSADKLHVNRIPRCP